MYAYIGQGMCVCMRMCNCVCVCVCMYMFVRVYVYMCVRHNCRLLQIFVNISTFIITIKF